MWFNQFKVISLFLALLCLFCINIYIKKKDQRRNRKKRLRYEMMNKKEKGG